MKRNTSIRVTVSLVKAISITSEDQSFIAHLNLICFGTYTQRQLRIRVCHFEDTFIKRTVPLKQPSVSLKDIETLSVKISLRLSIFALYKHPCLHLSAIDLYSSFRIKTDFEM